MRGISFRFSDLRSLFHHMKEETEGLKGAPRVQVPDLKKLTINFRSHSGILKLAVSIIELMKEFFPTSFDADLPKDEGMFSGRTPPVLLQSCSSSDLAVVLQGNKRESSQIEFGAHQAIIVQNQEAKKNLPNELQGGIALTIFESKGLEFDDILLYNFFKDSKVSDVWRVATSFLEHNQDLVKNAATDFCLQPRSLEFDEMQHKSLNGELKYLYTAITRARCNMWIYDEDEVRRLPMFDYWSKRGLVKVVKIEDVTEEDLFTVTSTPGEWKERGDYFKKKRLWEAAVKCYSKAGTESLHLEMEAKAYLLAQEAHKSKKKEEGYLRAAVGFLECDQQHHSLTCLGTAAKCIKNAKMHGDAARLFEKMLEHEQALKAFMKSRDLENCVRILQKMGKHDTAVKCLMRANHGKEALILAVECIKDLQVDTTASVTQLAYSYAKTYAQQNDREKLLHIMPLIRGTFQIQLLKKVGLYEDACEILIQRKQYEEAFQLLTAQGIFMRGIQLAKQQNNNKMVASFVLQAAEAEIISNGEITDPHILEYLVQFSKSDQHIDPLFKAKASLLLGRSKGDAKLCHLALKLYKDQKNMIGEVESFSTLAEIQQLERNPMGFLRLAIKALKVLRETCKLLSEQLSLTKPRASSTQCRRQTEDFYCLQKVEGGYLFPPNQHLWIGKLDKRIVELHPDGMLRLDVSKTLNAVLKHLKSYELKWVERIDALRRILQSKLESFTFHAQLQYGFLTRSFTSYTEKQLEEYLDLCILALEALEVSEAKETFFHRYEVKRALTSLFSPSVFPHLRLCQETHFLLLRKSSLASKLLQDRVNKLLSRSREPIRVDDLLEAWRILSALGRGLDQLERALQQEVEQAWRHPHSLLQFVCVKPEQVKNQHYFSSWLQACQTIREGGRMNGAIKLSLRWFVQIIVRRRSLRTISVANLVDILTTTSTALFAILSHCYAARRQHLAFYIPHTFEHTLQVFNSFNCSNSIGKSVLDACAQSVQEMRDLLKLEDDAFRSLWDVLDILVGKFRERYNVLNYAMRRADDLERGDAQQCLILVLTLFGNLAIYCGNAVTKLAEYQRQIYDALGPLATCEGTQAQILKQVWSEFASTSDLFRLVHKLLRSTDKENATVKRLEFLRGSTHLKINDVPVHRIPKCHLFPIPQHLQVHNPPVQLNTVSKVLQIPQTTSSQQHSVHPSFEQLITTPSHPATAQPTAAITASIMSVEGHDKLSPFMAQPITVSQTKNQTHSSTETFPSTSEYPGSVKEDESLPEKQPSQLPPSQSIARMISAEEPEDIENEEIETDEDIQEILAAHTEEKPLPPELEQQTSVEEDVGDQPDSSQVDENFCSTCAVPLKKLSSDPLDNVEAFKPHIRSEKHKRQEKLRAEFTHEVEDKFNSTKDILSGILGECNSVDNPSPSLVNFISAAQKEIEGDKQRLEQIKDRAEWEVGLSEVEMLDRLASLIKKGEAELQTTQNVPQELLHTTEADAYLEEAESDLDEDPIEKATPENMKNRKAKRRKQKKQKCRPKR